MKKHFFYLMLATGALLISLASCKKEEPTEPEPEPYSPVDYSCKCAHEDLVYVDAIQRTATTPGNIAHYHCNDCNRNFLDANATIQIKCPYLPEGNRSIDTTILNRVKHIFPFDPSFDPAFVTKAGLNSAKPFKATFGLLSSVSNFFYKQTEKEFMEQTMKSLNEIEGYVKEIYKDVNAIQAQMTDILKYLQSASYAAKISNILTNEKLIWQESFKAFLFIKYYFNQYNDGKIEEQELIDYIIQICRQWNKNSNLYTTTKSVLTEFSGGTIVATQGLSYPQVFHNYTNNYYYWEHQGYTDRVQWDMSSIASLSLGYFMASLYREYVEEYEFLPYRKTDSIALNFRLHQVDSLVKVDMVKMKLANSSYKRFHSYECDIILDTAAVVVNSEAIHDKYNTYNVCFTMSSNAEGNQTPFGISELNRCWDEKYNTGYQNTPTVDDFTMIQLSEPKKSIYKILATTAGIKNMPSSYCEKRMVEGYERCLFLRYNPTKLTGLFSDGLILEYNEYSILTKVAGSKSPDVIYLTQGLTDDCTLSDNYCELLWFYTANSVPKEGGTYHLVGRSSHYYEYCPYAQVFVKNYTGTVYDE